MPLDRERFLEDIEHSRRYAEKHSALQAGLLGAVRDDLAAGGSGWFERLARVWDPRRFGTRYEAPLLLIAGLHRETLAGRAPALAAEPALELLRSAPEGFFEALADVRLQTNEPARAAGWLLAACGAFLSRGTPFHLADFGASAGLTLIGDYLPRWTALKVSGTAAAEPDRWRDSPYPVLSRNGFDARPLRVAAPQDRLWLKACIWADDLERHARFDQAAELFCRLEREHAGPKLHEASFAEMPARLAAMLRPHAEEALLVFNAQATDFLPDDEYRKLREGVAQALEPWGDRGLWVELELPRGGGPAHELRARRWMDGRFESRVLAAGDAHGRELDIRKGWDFLRPLEPVAPPRITREESPASLKPGLYRFPPGGTGA